MAYEQRAIGGHTYTVPVGTRSDWQPGQAYNQGGSYSNSGYSSGSGSGSGGSNSYPTPSPNATPQQLAQQGFIVPSSSLSGNIGGYDKQNYIVPNPTPTTPTYSTQAPQSVYSEPAINSIPWYMAQQQTYTTPTYNTWSPPQVSAPPTAPQNPTVGTSPTLQNISPGTPTTTTTPTAPTTSMLPSTPSGFQVPSGSSPMTNLPSLDSLFNTYKQSTGQGDQAMKDYLGNQEFQGELQSGNIPMWQAADPMWRIFLMRLGYLQPQASQARMQALQSRLSQ